MASDESGDEAASRAQALYRPALTRLIQARDALRKLWKLENSDLGALVLLCALAITGLAWGWALRPPAGTPAPVPTPLQITMDFAGTRPLGLEVYSELTQEQGSAAELSINAFGYAARGPRAAAWDMGVQSFTGRFCTPKRYRSEGRPVRVGGQDYVDSGTVRIPAAAHADIFLVVHLCWRKDPLLELGDSYFSASLPRILVPNQAGTLTDILQLRGTSLYSYSPSGGLTPTGFGPTTWSWTSPLSGSGGGLVSSVIPVSGSNTAQIERDNHNNFYSGILFGVAGGAALSLIPALAVSIDRRKKGPAAPAGGSGSDTAATASAGEAPS